MSKRALIIGVNRPQNDPTFAPLRSAERDANDLASALHDCGFEVQSLIGQQATTAVIRDAIAELREQVDDKSDLFIAFCGHGAWIPVDGHPDGATFLVSADYLTQRAKKNPKHYLSLDWWYEELLDWNEPRSVVLVLDCCFAGNVAQAAERRSIGDAIEQHFRGVTVPTGRLRAYLAATVPGEKAYEDDRGGWLTQRVVACLSDKDCSTDGMLTVPVLIDAVKKQHSAHFHPFAEYRGDYHWVLADHREARRVAREKQQAEQRRAEAQQRLKRWQSPHSSARRNELLHGFVGRVEELAQLSDEIEKLRASGGYLLVTGVAGQGKSSILAKLIKHREPEPTPAYFIRFTPGPSEQAALLGHLIAGLLTLAEREDDALTYLPDGDNVVALRNSFETLLSNLAAERPLTLVIDGLDQIEPDQRIGQRDLSFLPEQLPSNVVLVIGTRPDDTLKPLKLRTPHREYCLPPLSEADFAALLRDRGVTLSAHEQSELYQALNGNAFDLAFLAQEIRQTPTTEIAALLRRVIANPRDLFTPTLERLQRYQSWDNVLRPLLGTLLVAQEPLSRDALRAILNVTQDRVTTAIERLGGLLGVRDAQGQPRYSLIHLKLIDYLRTHMFATDDLIDVHAKIAAWCSRDLAHLWQPGSTPAEQERRAYGQTHLVTHLAAAQKHDDVWRLLDADEYGAAKRRADPSLRAYIADLDRVRQTIADASDRDRQQMATWLARAWRYSLLRVSLTGKVDAWPTELFTALVAMGRGTEARDRAELLSDPKQRAEVLTAVGRALLERGAAGGLEAFRRARAAAEAISDPYERAEALRDLAQALAAAGDDAAAQQTFAAARQSAEAIADPSWRASWSLVALARALAAAGQWEDARQTADAIDSPYLRAEALRKLAQALAAAGQWEDARQTADAIADPEKRAWALGELAQALAAAGQWEDARQTADAIADPEKRAEALGELAQALAHAGQWEDARQTADAIADPDERAKALGELAQALAYAGQWEDARQTADAIADPFWRAKALVALARALAAAGDDVAARQTFAAARQTADAIADPEKRAWSLVALARALAAAGDDVADRQTFAAARQSVAAIADSSLCASLCAWVLGKLAQALAHAGQWADAQQTFAAARQTADAIDSPYLRAEALGELAQALAAAGDDVAARQTFAAARQTADAIADPDERAKALGELAQALAAAGQWVDARQTADAIADPEKRAVALGELAQALAAAGDDVAARQTFAAARQSAKAIADPSWRASWSLVALARALAYARQWEDARQTADAIADPSWRAVALGELAQALAAAGQWADARQTADAIADLRERAWALGKLAQALAAAGDDAAARQTFAAARQTADAIADPEKRAVALGELAQALAAAGQWADARQTSDAIADPSWHASWVLGELAQALAAAGQWEDARQTADEIADPEKRAEALRALAQALAAAGDDAAARQTFAAARQSAEAIADLRERAEALRALAQALAAVGNDAAVRQTFAAARQSAEAIADLRERAEALCALAQALIRAGQIDDAMALLVSAWAQAQTVNELTTLFVVDSSLLRTYPTLGGDLLAAFGWVEQVVRAG
jgi:tetratricopeptide (TPR) repeat protein